MVDGQDERSRIASFADVARRYCALIDEREGMAVRPFLRALRPLLAELHFRACLLPEVESESDEALPGVPTRDETLRLLKSLESFLGEYDVYWEVFDPYELDDDDPMHGTVSDDLADIYRDLQTDLATVLSGSEIPLDAVWGWRFSHATHWGMHAIGAMRAIESLWDWPHPQRPPLTDDDDESR